MRVEDTLRQLGFRQRASIIAASSLLQFMLKAGAVEGSHQTWRLSGGVREELVTALIDAGVVARCETAPGHLQLRTQALRLFEARR